MTVLLTIGLLIGFALAVYAMAILGNLLTNEGLSTEFEDGFSFIFLSLLGFMFSGSVGIVLAFLYALANHILN